MRPYRERVSFLICLVLLPFAVGDPARARIVYAAQNPTLSDVFDGNARFQTIEESEEVTLDFNVSGDGYQHVWDQKLPILFDEQSRRYYAFTRGYVEGTKVFKVVVLTSRNGRDFRQEGVLFEPLHSDPALRWTFYDPHLSRDGDRYILTTECANRRHGASVCISETRTPFRLSSWSEPKLIVRNSQDRSESASTGVSVSLEGRTYLTWTVVDDGPTPFSRKENGVSIVNDEDGDESTFSKALLLYRNPGGEFAYVGESADIGTIIMHAESDPYCDSRWDCNNVDIQDWKIEGGKVYAIYNGSNYYRCARPSGDADRKNEWGIAIRRADHPLGPYSEASGILIRSSVDDVCGISYPVLNEVGGSTYLYFAHYSYDAGGRRTNRTMRSRLLWDAALPITLQTRGIEQERGVTDVENRTLTLKIGNVYERFYGRAPSDDELGRSLRYTKNRGYGATVKAIVLSDEHRALWASRDVSERIESLYEGILGRSPDPLGSARYRALLEERGESLETLLGMFVDSAEFTSGN